jgi:hypothetical protein
MMTESANVAAAKSRPARIRYFILFSSLAHKLMIALVRSPTGVYVLMSVLSCPDSFWKPAWNYSYGSRLQEV